MKELQNKVKKFICYKQFIPLKAFSNIYFDFDHGAFFGALMGNIQHSLGDGRTCVYLVILNGIRHDTVNENIRIRHFERKYLVCIFPPTVML